MGGLVHLEGNELIIREQTLMMMLMMMVMTKGMRGPTPPCLPALHDLLFFSPIIYFLLLIID